MGSPESSVPFSAAAGESDAAGDAFDAPDAVFAAESAAVFAADAPGCALPLSAPLSASEVSEAAEVRAFPTGAAAGEGCCSGSFASFLRIRGFASFAKRPGVRKQNAVQISCKTSGIIAGVLA